MKLLKKVKILGRNYTVEYFDFDNVLSDNNMYGSFDDGRQRIQINTTVHKELQELTLLHEVIHLTTRAVRADMDEEQVTRLANGLYQVFKDNDLFALSAEEKQNKIAAMVEKEC